MTKVIGNTEPTDWSEITEDSEQPKEESKQCSLEESCRLTNHGCHHED